MLSYRALILNHSFPNDQKRTKVWLLDAKKLRQDFKKNVPSKDYQRFVFDGVRNIGTQTFVYRYDGEQKLVTKPIVLNYFTMKMYKVGEPEDNLVAYVYTVGKEDLATIPFGKDFASESVAGKTITSDSKGQAVKFQFFKPLVLTPGPYWIVICRTGKPDDKNFYRIYIDNQELIQSYIEAAKLPVN